MKKFLYSIICISTMVVYAQSSIDSTQQATISTINIAEWDDNLFYCNWHNTQTFAYFLPQPDTLGGLAVELLKENEKFYLPRYGTLWSVFKKTHKGLDIDLKIGDTVLNMFDGIVRYAQFNTGGFGNLVIIRHYNGLETYYGHLSKIKVKINQKVKAGELLGFGGNTGRSYNPHLHLEVRYKDHPIDPFTFIDWENKTLKTNVLLLDKKTFSPWDLGIEPTTILKPSQINLAKNNTTNTTNASSNIINNNATYHTIKMGDTLYSIAKKNGTTVQLLCNLNNITDSNKINLGQQIRVK